MSSMFEEMQKCKGGLKRMWKPMYAKSLNFTTEATSFDQTSPSRKLPIELKEISREPKQVKLAAKHWAISCWGKDDFGMKQVSLLPLSR